MKINFEQMQIICKNFTYMLEYLDPNTQYLLLCCIQILHTYVLVGTSMLVVDLLLYLLGIVNTGNANLVTMASHQFVVDPPEHFRLT